MSSEIEDLLLMFLEEHPTNEPESLEAKKVKHEWPEETKQVKPPSQERSDKLQALKEKTSDKVPVRIRVDRDTHRWVVKHCRKLGYPSVTSFYHDAVWEFIYRLDDTIASPLSSL